MCIDWHWETCRWSILVGKSGIILYIYIIFLMGNLEEFKSSVEWIAILPTVAEDYLAAVLLGKMQTSYRFILGGKKKHTHTEKSRTKASINF